jgi:hypothetical protein
MAVKKSNDSKDDRVPHTYVAIPRRCLIVLAVIQIALCIELSSIWLRPVSHAGSGEVENAAHVQAVHAGKWGDLKLVPIVISPPMELVYTNWGFMRQPTWFFPDANTDMVVQTLQSAGVLPTDAARLRAAARPEPRIAGVVLSPDPAWVRSLPQETRARIYYVLAKSGLNVDQNQAFRYPGENPEKWLGSSLISAHTRQLVEPLIYREGGYMLFSDIELVRSEIGSESELRRLGKVLFQQPTAARVHCRRRHLQIY